MTLPLDYKLPYNFFYAFVLLTVDGYNSFEAFANLLNSKYNNCFKVDDISKYYNECDVIANDLKKGLVPGKKQYDRLYLLIYGYAYVCCKYHLSDHYIDCYKCLENV